MATLHVRDVPDDLYERLRREAERARRSISAETVSILRQALPPGEAVSLDELLETADAIRAQHRLAPGGSTAAELVREDRDR